jgi:hypothetical protein
MPFESALFGMDYSSQPRKPQFRVYALYYDMVSQKDDKKMIFVFSTLLLKEVGHFTTKLRK